MTASLQSALESVEPTINELARNLKITPEELLCEAIESKKREWARAQLKQAVAEAEASGFRPVNLETWSGEMKTFARHRHAEQAS